jgi:hypothetical protein
MGIGTRWSGWVGFAAWVMIWLGALNAFEGIIAIVRDRYYVLAPSQIIVFDVSTWGWILLIWGVVVACAGMALLGRRGWARWLTIVLASLNVIGQLGFVGSSANPLWALTTIAFSILVVYALIVHWEEFVAAP